MTYKFSSQDFPQVYEGLNIDTRRMGCIMLDTEPLPSHLLPSADWAFYDDEMPWVKGFEPAAEPHITLLYGLLERGETWREHVDAVLKDWSVPVKVWAQDVEFFDTPADAPYQPVVLRPGLQDHRQLVEANKRLSLLPHINTFPEYKSHVTIGYIRKDKVEEAREFYLDLEENIYLKITGLNYGR